jgi:hypothetical protein
MLCAPPLYGQQGSAPAPSVTSISTLNRRLFLQHLAQDQLRIWTSPQHLKSGQAAWLLPMAGITTGLMLTDRTTEPQIARGNVNRAATFADASLAAYGGSVAGLYVLGHVFGSETQQETGLLAAEAGINSLAVGELFKLAFRRERPYQGDGKGEFFRSGGSSFYSLHSTLAWSFASVIAEEYPGFLTKAIAYGAATAISGAQLKANRHFASDVFVGALTGYLIGHAVYHSRHDPAIDEDYGEFYNSHPEWNSGNAGTTYVPLDSWVYPALDRLMAAGVLPAGFMGMRPWTRTAIADLLAGVDDTDAGLPVALRGWIQQLRSEFSDELRLGSDYDNRAIRLESLYTRSLEIAGPPLTDSYHFGQTLINDFGRPYRRGFNQVSGFTARAEEGRFAFFVRGEYQHAPAAAAYPLSLRQVIANVDGTPLQPPLPTAQTDQFQLLDAYASMTLAGHVISLGRQSLWWGRDMGDAMIMSSNIQPFYSFRINRAVPLILPSFLKFLGPLRYDGFFGELEGHQFPPRPFIHGEKFTFQPTDNFEFGFSRTAVFAGEGVTPLTFGNFWTSFTSATSSTNPGANLRTSPGARHSAFDFSYRIPGLRNWLTVYSDSLVHDDVSPVDAPRRAAINPGIYLAKFPGISKLDLRVEAVNTDPPITNSHAGSFIYFETIYRDVYTNNKNLMGSWIGREGKGIQAWTTYWLSPVSTLQLSYRNAKVAKDFIPRGETINDFSFSTRLRLRSDLELKTLLQYETWNAPILAPGRQTNVTTSVQLTFWPKHLQFARR